MKLRETFKSLLKRGSEKAGEFANEAVKGASDFLPRRKKRGHDSAFVEPKADVLNRHRIARDIYRLISENSTDQSVRIGLFGDWGYGKTTIANWVDALATEKGDIVVWFNPWSVRSIPELWAEFAAALHDALIAQGVKVPSWSGLKAKLVNARADYGAFAGSLAGSRLAGAANSLLHFSPQDIEAIATQLKGRRVVVCIDDIDRVDPTLLPNLLLSLSELLDLPGFAFVVPFEKRIVAEALQKHHPAWGTGERFLEKILDFQVTIPATTEEERWQLFEASVGEVLPSGALDKLHPYRSQLPDNPRRVKKLARALQLFTSALERHNLEEVDWISLLFGSLMRLESEEFFKRYRERVLDSYDERIAEGMARDNGGREAAQKKRIEELLGQCKIVDDQAKRLSELALKWEGERSYYFTDRIKYTLRLIDRPDAFTWKEIDTALDAWGVPTSYNHVRQAIDAKQLELSYSREAIVKEFIESLNKKYHQHLEQAAGAFSTAQHARAIASARRVLERLEVIAFDGALVSEDNRFEIFSGLLAAVKTWGHFTSNAADADLRCREVQFLTKLVDNRGNHWRAYASKLRADDFDDRHKEFNELVAVLGEKCTNAAAETAVGAFSAEDGVAELLKDRENTLAHALLLNPESVVWKDGGAPGALVRVLEGAAASEVVQQNAHALLRFAENRGVLNLAVGSQTLVALVKSDSVAVALWNAATSTQIQYRMLSATRSVRRFLIEQGVPEDRLQFPDWLHAGEEREVPVDPQVGA